MRPTRPISDPALVRADEPAADFFRNILESSTEYSIIGKDLTGKILFWNEGARRLYGYGPEEVVGQANSSILHVAEDVKAGKPQRMLQAALAQGRWEGTLARRRRDGTQFLARVVVTPRHDDQGKPIGYLLMSKDVRSEIAFGEELRKAKLFDGAIVGNAQEAVDFISNILESSTEYSVIGKNLDGKILLWNEGARRLYGYEPEEVVGQANSIILHTPEDVASGRPQEMLDTALRTGKWEGTITRLRKNGERFTARVVVTPRRDSTGRAIGFLLISKDISAEIRLTEELRAAQFYARSLIEASLDPLVTISPDGKITDVNEASVQATGVPRERLIGTDFSDYFTEPDEARKGYQRVFSEGFVRDYPLAIRHVTGRLTDVLYNASVYKDDKGKVLGVFAAARDVTAQKQASQYARSLIEASLDPLVTISPDGKITDVNDASAQATGVTRDKLIGADFSNYFTEPDKAREGYQRVFSEGFVRDYPLAVRHVSGRATDVLYNASVYKDDKGKVLGVFAAARDVTAQKQASQYARSLIEASLDPLVTISPDGKITDVNEASVQATGVPRDRLIGTDFSDYFTEPEKAREGYQRVYSEGFVRDYPLAIRHSSGRITDVLYNASLYRDDRGNVLGVFAAARDVTARKLAEAKQRVAAAYSRSLIEASLDPLVTINAEGKITDVNQATELATGIPRQRLIGTDFSNYFTEPGKAREGYQQVFSQGFVKDYPLAIRHSSGRITDVLYNASVYKDEKGAVIGVFAAARDVTDRKIAEDLQRASSAYARSLIEASLDPLVTVSSDGKITDVNEASVEATGVPREQLIGTDFSDYFTEPDKAREGYRQVFSQGFVRDYPLAIRHVSGRVVDVLYNASVFRDDKGQVLGAFAAARDITALKQASQYARSLIEASLDPLVTISPDGKITDVNEASVQATGVPRERLIGRDFSDYFTEPDKARDGYQQVFSQGFVRDYPLAIRHVSGRVTDVLYNASVYKDAKGRVLGVFAAARDVTERRRYEKSLQEASRMKSEFLANMSHELRTPLNGIIGFSEFVIDGKPGPLNPKQKEYLGDILNNGRHLLQLINDVLDLSKVEAGKMEFNPEVFAPARAIEEVCAVAKALAQKKRIILRQDVSPALENVVLDQQKFKQVLYNLLSNAVKFTDDGGSVEISAHPHTQNRFIVSVRDTGIGIKQSDLPRLFREFEQLDAGAARKYEGTGLGLAITKKIVEFQKGYITVESEPRKGSTFSIVLPRKAE
jgi:PAS domain S-box-containing protein